MAKRVHRRRLTAKQAKYFAPRKYRRNPVKRRRSTARRLKRNPAPRTARYGSMRAYRRTQRRAKLGNFVSGYGLKTAVPAAIGAAGALALDMTWGALPLPASVQTGPLAPVARLAGAAGLGYAAGMVVNKKFAGEIAVGATIVTLYDLFKGYLKTNFPTLGLNGVGMYVGNARRRRLRRHPLGMYVGRYNAAVNVGRPSYLGEYSPDYVNEYTQDSAGIAYQADPEPQY